MAYNLYLENLPTSRIQTGLAPNDYQPLPAPKQNLSGHKYQLPVMTRNRKHEMISTENRETRPTIGISQLWWGLCEKVWELFLLRLKTKNPKYMYCNLIF